MTGKEIYEQEKIVVLGINDISPLENHGGMEIGFDGKLFYIREIMLVTYGADSVIKACREYREAVSIC